MVLGGQRTRIHNDIHPKQLLTTAMATFSAYLMWLLATQLKELCPYCLASASLSFGMAALTWSKRVVPDATKAAVRALAFIVGPWDACLLCLRFL